MQDRVAGEIARPDGVAVPGRRFGSSGGVTAAERTAGGAKAWSPEQISHRLRVDFPDDETMRISAEAIYQALFVEGRGALKRELVACVRTGRVLRVPARPSAGPREEVRDAGGVDQ